MKGIGVSAGIAVGKAFIVGDNIEIKKNKIKDIEFEVDRFNGAVMTAKEDIKEIMQDTTERLGNDEAQIFQVHLLILEDPDFIGPILKKITEGVNSEWAIKETVEKICIDFDDLENEYIKERIADIQDVSMRVIRNLASINNKPFTIEDETVIVAKNLTPADTVYISKGKVKGFITEEGGTNSHTAIVARALGIPAIVGAKDILQGVSDGDILLIDGEDGQYYIKPDKVRLTQYLKKQESIKQLNHKKKQLIGKETVTIDGYKVKVRGNIGSSMELGSALENGVEGIGLFRSEYLYMNRKTLPSEDDQLIEYERVLKSMAGKDVIIRTLDLGGDKIISSMEGQKKFNSFLGYRGIRYCLGNKDLFKTQLRALLRASVHGNLSIMFPMITSISELTEAKYLLEEAKKELLIRGEEYSHIKIGVMIEVPAAALISDVLAKEVDFFSIGTNDLIQYTMAVDRMSQELSTLYNPYHPGLLKLIKMVIDNAHEENIPVSVCGEAATDLKLVPILVGMGLDEFSVNSSSVLAVRNKICSIGKEGMKDHVNKVLKLRDSEEVLKYLSENIDEEDKYYT